MTAARSAATVRVTWQLVAAQRDAADRLLAREVAGLLGCPETMVHVGRHCPRCGSSEHGRPVVRTDLAVGSPSVSLSRAPGVVVVAVSAERPVGVDIEREDAAGRSGPTEAVLHDRERARTATERTMVWVRKESLLKATGDGLHVDPRRVRLDAAPADPRLLQWPEGGDAPAVWMQDLHIEGYAACLTVLGPEPAEVIVRQAAPAAASR